SALRYIAAGKRKAYIFTLQDLIRCRRVENLSSHALDYEISGTATTFFSGSLHLPLDHKYLIAKVKLLNGFNITGLLRLAEPLNRDVFAQAFRLTTTSHEAVRSNFTHRNDGWHMDVIEPGNNFYLGEYHLISLWDGPGTGAQLNGILHRIQHQLSLADA